MKPNKIQYVRIKESKEKLIVLDRQDKITIIQNKKGQIFKIPNIYLEQIK